MAKSKSNSMKKPSGHKPAGGPFGSKVVQKPVRTGGPNKAIAPGFVAQQGPKVGEARAVIPMANGPSLQSKLGNQMAADAVCGPGGSRTVQKSGSQAQHGPSAPGRPEPTSELFPGFGGKK